MDETTVVNIKDRRLHRDWKERGGVYIGRRNRWHLVGNSSFAHPVREGEVIDRPESIALYKDWFYQQLDTEPGFGEAVEQLRGKMLVCWCKPEKCHGDIIVEYLEREG
jgi:hypothetical protein